MNQLRYRTATSVDVPAMARCRASDPEARPADDRMAAYLEGQHHPQQALGPRTAFVALAAEEIIGYTAGHATTRFGYDGEVQYLYVAPRYRRRAVARNLIRLLAAWFVEHGIRRVCVNVDLESPGAEPFYAALGARPSSQSRRYWYVWEDIETLLILPEIASPAANEPG